MCLLSLGGKTGKVRSVAWDVNADRLAVSLGGTGGPGATVALFATALEPLLSARLIGFIRHGSATSKPCGGCPGNGTAFSSSSGCADCIAKDVQAADEEVRGEKPAMCGVEGVEAALAFQANFKGGSLLAVRWNDAIMVLPLYYNA